MEKRKKLPLYVNKKAAIICGSLVKKGGKFTESENIDSITRKAKPSGLEIGEDFQKELSEIIKPSDSAIVAVVYVFPHRIYPKTDNKSVQYFLLDKKGVRAHLKRFIGWKKIKRGIRHEKGGPIKNWSMINRQHFAESKYGLGIEQYYNPIKIKIFW